MKTLRHLPLLLAATISVACASPSESASPSETQPVPDAASADLAEFSWRFYRQLAEADDNLVFSPFSIASVFAMLSAGAHGETLAELRQALGFSGEDDIWHASQGALLESLAALSREGDDYRNAQALRVANDLWLQRDFDVQQPFLDLLARHYDSAPRPLDFRADAEGSRKNINAKVAKDTAELIRELLPEGSVTSDARLVLTNALYFKGAWMHRFSESATQPGDFHTLDGRTVEVPMMRVTARFAYADHDDWQAISLPYDENELDMLVLMPKPARFRDVAGAIDAGTIATASASFRHTRIRLSFPKFELRTSLPLVPELQRAGMHRIFSDAAELDGIADNLYVSAAVHQAVIEVDEQGTEAAAATAAVISLTSMPMQEPEPLEVRIDRPFLFVIRAQSTGAVLFVGHMLAP